VLSRQTRLLPAARHAQIQSPTPRPPVLSQAAGIQSYLKSDAARTIVAKFVQLAQADAIFGDNPSAGIVLFAATDSAWQAAAGKLGE